MARRTKPLTDQELRDRGVPEHVLEHRRSPHRVWHGPMVGVVVDGPTVEVVAPSAEVAREQLARKIHEARCRFKPRED